MRLASFSTTLAIACMSLISLPVSAQQTQGTSDPLPGPPTITAPRRKRNRRRQSASPLP
jgi:hypothetical protein